MVVIPPFALPGQTENTLSTDADVEALAKSMVEIAFQSVGYPIFLCKRNSRLTYDVHFQKEVQGIRAMNPRPPEVETKLSEVENTSSLDSEDAADHLRFFDKACCAVVSATTIGTNVAHLGITITPYQGKSYPLRARPSQATGLGSQSRVNA